MPIEELSVVMLPDGRMDTPNTSIYTGVAIPTLARWRCEGTGARFVKRGKIFYFKADLDEWMMSHGTSQSAAEARQKQHDQKQSV